MGSEQVGALTKEGNRTQETRKPPKGELENMKQGIKVQLASGTSNFMNYQAYKKLPETNRINHVNLRTGFGKFYGQTAYGQQFVNVTDQSFKENFKLERQRVKEHKERHVRGHLSPSRKLPFIAK